MKFPMSRRLAGASALLIALSLAPATFAQQVTVTHPQGETVISGVPETVIVTDWAAFDNLSALGIEITGLPTSNPPTYLADQISADALRVGSLQEPDIEAIVTADPDLVIVASRSRTSYPTLAGIVTTIDGSVDNAALLEGVTANIELYGEIFAVQDRAAELIDALDAKVEEARQAAEGKGTGLVIVTNAGNIGIYGPESRVSWIYNTLNVPSVFDEVDDSDHGGDAISFEYLLDTNPDWLFVVDRDAGVGNQGAALQLLDNELIHQTNFWQNDQMVFMDSEAAYTTMHGYQALMLLLDQVIAGYNSAS